MLKSLKSNLKDAGTDSVLLNEPRIKTVAHLPLLAIFYLSMQRQVSATPVTALELSAYLGVEVSIMEEMLKKLEQRGMVQAFKEGIPAYVLTRELEEVNAKELLAMVLELDDLYEKSGTPRTSVSTRESNEKYRRIYSELASEILQLFGEDSANQLPL